MPLVVCTNQAPSTGHQPESDFSISNHILLINKEPLERSNPAVVCAPAMAIHPDGEIGRSAGRILALMMGAILIGPVYARSNQI
jgi:hypothetical protein